MQDIEQIKRTLPHRAPFLLIDRVLEVVPDQSVKALKNVTYNEPFFQGHFPEQSVMPGVLILEAMAQAGGFMLMSTHNLDGQLCYLTSVDKAKFRRPVVPGDQLIFDVKLKRVIGSLGKVEGTASVDGQVVAEAELGFAFAGKKINS